MSLDDALREAIQDELSDCSYVGESECREYAQEEAENVVENHGGGGTVDIESALPDIGHWLDQIAAGTDCHHGDPLRRAVESILVAKGVVTPSSDFGVPSNGTQEATDLRSLQAALRAREDSLGGLRNAVHALWGSAPNGEESAPELSQIRWDDAKAMFQQLWTVARQSTHLLALMRGVIRFGDSAKATALANSWLSEVDGLRDAAREAIGKGEPSSDDGHRCRWSLDARAMAEILRERVTTWETPTQEAALQYSGSDLRVVDYIGAGTTRRRLKDLAIEILR